jgi:hypothetical protein
MGLFDWLGSKINGHAQQRARVVVADTHNLTGRDLGTAAVAEQHYVRLWISEMFLKNDKKWFSERFPLAYSLIGIEYAGQKTEIANISGKNRFEIKQADLGHSILHDYPLTPLLPFRGGTVEMDCGLVSMEAENVLQSFAGVVSDIAAKVNVPQVAAVVGIAGTIAASVQTLLGAGKAETLLYVHQSFDTNTLISGYTYLSGKQQNDVDPAKIWITSNGIRTGTSATSLSELDAQDFIVLRIEVVQQRDDWRSMTAIAEPLDGAIQASLTGEPDKAKLLIAQAKLAALKSKDLTQLDKMRVIKGMDAEVFGDPAPAGATEGAALFGIRRDDEERPSAIERAVSRISIADALAASPITEEDVLAELAYRSGW